MPSRNVVKVDVPASYYHVYARGHGRKAIFRDAQDFDRFLTTLERYLSPSASSDNKPTIEGVDLLCYCLMNNHFHLLFYQADQGAMSKVMRRVMTSYSMYFNRKYDSSGALFESRYKASRISSDPYLMHISRYIHLNPSDWTAYPYSSIHAYYLGAPDWLHPEPVIELFGSLPKYADFLNDYADYEDSLDSIADEIANSLETMADNPVRSKETLNS